MFNLFLFYHLNRILLQVLILILQSDVKLCTTADIKSDKIYECFIQISKKLLSLSITNFVLIE